MRLGPDELGTQTLRASTLGRAAAAVRADGFVVLESVLDPAATEEARETCLGVLRRKNRLRAALPYELLPRSPFREILDHPILLQVVTGMLGEEAAPHGFRWIRCCPPGGTSIARVHRDTSARKSPDGGPPPLELSVDVMLTEFSEANGATEIWPGTQASVEGSTEELESIGRRAEALPSARVTGPAGSLAIRDQRAWHRAGRNTTGADRVMLSVGEHR